MFKHLAIAKRVLLALTMGLISASAFAAEYRVDVTANIRKSLAASSIFGLTDEVTPIQYSFVVDDTSAPVIPIGTVITSEGHTADRQLTLFSSSAIKEFNISIGNQSFAATNLVNRFLGNTGQSYRVMIEGALTGNSSPKVSLNLSKSGIGYVVFGDILCDELTCVLTSSGQIDSFIDSQFASVTDISTTVTALAKTPQEQIADLISYINNMSIEVKVKNSLISYLGAALDLLENPSRTSVRDAKRKLDAFIAKVKTLSGKKIPKAQADFLIAEAKKIKSQF